MVGRGLLAPICAGYAPPEDQHAIANGIPSGANEDVDLLRSFDDAAGWLFAYAGGALRDPFAPPSPTQVSVMVGIQLDVRVTHWVEVRGCDSEVGELQQFYIFSQRVR